jgi:hypothetical protein
MTMPLIQLGSSPALIVIDLQKIVVEKVFPPIGETTTTDEVLKRLQATAAVTPDVVVAK